MQTQTTENTATPTPPTVADDVVRRGIKRVLPCKLTEEEFVEIAKKRVAREALLKQCEADLAKEQKRRKDQIAELEGEIGAMGINLHTESEDRTVLCNEIFRRGEDGTGYVHTIRLDTNEEVERRPASVSETQRYLPTDGFAPQSGASVLDQARSAQGAAAAPANGASVATDEPDEIKPEDLDDEDEADDEDEDDNDKPKRGKRKGK